MYPMINPTIIQSVSSVFYRPKRCQFPDVLCLEACHLPTILNAFLRS